MSSVAVDTSALLSILKGEARGALWLECLQSAAETGPLLASSVVWAEIRSFFPSDEKCRVALRKLDVRYSPLTEHASMLAGMIFREYRNEGGPRMIVLPDFLVAAHAASQAEFLATDDRGYLRRYFPDIRLLAP